MAVLDRQSIPKSLIQREGENPISFVKALGTIQAFSLISAEKGRDVYEMHRLVHLFVQKWLDAEGKRASWEEEALILLDARLPWDSQESRATCEALRSHAEAVLYKSITKLPSDMRRAGLLHRLARYEDSLGRYEAANKKLAEALEIYTLNYGPLHTKSLRILGFYASNLGDCGRDDEAEIIYRRILEVLETKYGTASSHVGVSE
jgi:tetratricopeptide (TPR) repeat protein